MAITHSFVSTKQDSSDTAVVRKTEWNADHVIDITTAAVPDSADKRYCTDAQKTVIGNTSGTNSGDSATPAETATTIGALIGGAGDATPNDTDFVATSLTTGGILKKITWTNVKAFLKTYFDTLYNKYVHPNHSGDVTSVADGAQTIANSAVTYAKMQNVSATDKILGRASTGAGVVEEIACTAAGRALIDDASASAQRTTLSLGNVDNTSDATKNAATVTLTNKRITARVQSVTDAATITPDADANDAVDITAIAQAFTIANPTGTPTNFQKLLIRIKDNATAHNISWGNGYVAGGVALPPATVLSKITNIALIYNTANSLNKWQCVAVSTEA